MKNPILSSISQWFNRNFSDPAAVGLFMTLLFGLIILEFFGGLLAPVFVSIVIAYLLLGLVRLFERWKCPHMLAVILAYLLFVGFIAYLLMGLMPLLWKQLSNLVNELPHAFTKGQVWVNDLIHHYPTIFSGLKFQHVEVFLKNETAKVGQVVLKYSLSGIPNVIQAVLYLILVPLLVFFFLKDSVPISRWFSRYLPTNRSLVVDVWDEVNAKIGCYVRGRVLEVLIIGFVSSVAFSILNLQYAILLGALVGLSVMIPYVGAVVVTVPVVIVALMQWGFSAHFSYLIIVYTLIVVLDANVLVPVLFSETMDLHPVVIILSVVIFGGIWGFWGVFFAIPLATLVDSVLRSWPKHTEA